MKRANRWNALFRTYSPRDDHGGRNDPCSVPPGTRRRPALETSLLCPDRRTRRRDFHHFAPGPGLLFDLCPRSQVDQMGNNREPTGDPYARTNVNITNAPQATTEFRNAFQGPEKGRIAIERYHGVPLSAGVPNDMISDHSSGANHRDAHGFSLHVQRCLNRSQQRYTIGGVRSGTGSASSPYHSLRF